MFAKKKLLSININKPEIEIKEKNKYTLQRILMVKNCCLVVKINYTKATEEQE